MKLSQLQTQILNNSDDKTVVISAAAAGKTALLTEKVRQLLSLDIPPQEIVVITFTNMAAGELRKRLGEDYHPNLFIGTVHSLANKFLTSAGIDTSDIIAQEKFDDLFDLIDDNINCVPHKEWVIFDEAQDSDYRQFKFLFEDIMPEHFFVVGDVRQCIYRWHGAHPELLEKLARRTDVALFNMNENYRNGSEILKFGGRLIAANGIEDNSIAMRRTTGQIIEGDYTLKGIYTAITTYNDYGHWAVLCRTNAEVDTISDFLKSKDIPVDSFKQRDLTNEELDKCMAANTVKVLTVHSAKGLEWDKVIVVGMRYQVGEERNICYVAATRARDVLIWLKTPAKKKKVAARPTHNFTEWE